MEPLPEPDREPFNLHANRALRLSDQHAAALARLADLQAAGDPHGEGPGVERRAAWLWREMLRAQKTAFEIAGWEADAGLDERLVAAGLDPVA